MPTAKPKSLGVHTDTGVSLDDVADHQLHQFAHRLLETAAPHEHLVKKASTPNSHPFDPRKLHQAGWGILYGRHVSQQIKDALAPLIAHRRAQVNNDALFKIFEGEEGYSFGNTAASWLTRRSVALTEAVPLTGVPYYVMIVASPNDIPFEFQYGLDLNWAVGRIWFSSPVEFAHYAESVVRYEKLSKLPNSRHMAVYATCNEGDDATRILTEVLAKPMVLGTSSASPFGTGNQFQITPFIDGAATKSALSDICSGSIANGPPALLFTGSHGMVFRSGDHRQDSQQGAVVCQEWKFGAPPSRDQYFAAEDLPSNLKVHGMVHILFCCYGGGWPRLDNYDLSAKPPEVGPRPHMARLPQALMSHRDGGALAVLAHIDRVWSMTFQQAEHEAHVSGFRTVMEMIMTGNRVGHATDRFNHRWATLSADLTHALAGHHVDVAALTAKWLARDNARNFVMYGDPAVRLRVEHMPPIVPSQVKEPSLGNS